ncbi:transferrin-binding protein-like solute binding protein [Neisseria flavescens]|uniref:Transferrin-binding protein B n=1 Tax=Neisseria flavescens NRL30031/H210 TaxID=546264 RepID=C0EKQ7_NEIFL|nr:transferrin-binding protein-like solute binding protein [Neisseria flavescens]SPY03714.1 transferrin-binding protein B [Neisseria meningitidis]EEG34340.1 transferrin binding protein-like solute binding protein [Neisseria flavescens NRL30031/H210]QCL68396.1 transferrin-binding protein-like solute binding protein [Neisseria flavescens]SPY06062.1 transferrin-binding protein B [Neisseria meningitidis]STZ65654.1 transferrin-binding protein B [Neisseria flavescens]
MKKSLIAQAAGILPVLLLSACAGGGSFDLDSVETKPHNPQPEAPKYQDEQTEKPAKPDEAQAAENERSAYGFAAKIPRRNWYKNKEDHKALSEADWEKLGAGEPGEFRQKNEIFAMDKGTLNESITTGDGKSRVEGYTAFKYVGSGYIYRNGANKIDLKNDIALFGPDGYLFYKGSNPSQALPTGKAIYKGTWDYVTDAKGKQKFPQLGSPPAGDRYGALSAEEADVLRNESEAPEGQTDFGLTSEFKVDFAAKTMTGALYRNNRITHNETENKTKQIKRYDIQANLHGNRFKGKALAADKDTGNGHPFVSDSDSLEGGFYGPQGDELGGKFLAKDKKVLAVFSAKQKDGAEKPLAETFMDAYRIGADFVKKQIDSFGNVAKLLIDGVELSLLPSEGNKAAFQHGIEQNGVKATVCCSNLDYMSFGKLSKENKDDMFLQGVRTPVSDVAARTEANAKYRGTWYGYIVNGTSWSGEASNQESGNRAEFDVNFAKKTLNGMLTAKDRIDPAFTITAQIQGNGFSGVAKTGEKGFALDPKSTIDPVYTHIQADVSGGFYGKNAIEMGGSFSGNTLGGENGKAAVVFGAKRQQLVQ